MTAWVPLASREVNKSKRHSIPDGSFIADQRISVQKKFKTQDLPLASPLESERLLQNALPEMYLCIIDLGKLSAGLTAAFAGKDIDTAATTGGNAAEHNMFVIITVVLELMDKGLQAYDAYRLAKAIGAGDTDEAAEISAEIALGAATDAIPANVVAIKIGIAVKKFGLAGLGAKIVGKFGDEAGDAWRVAGKAVHKTGFDEVTEFIGQHGKLPDNFITKKEAKALGWDSSKGNLHEIAPGKSIGGDIYENRSGILPDAPDRTWIEVDINYDQGYRGPERLIISNDGLMYKTTDHYKSFQRIR